MNTSIGAFTRCVRRREAGRPDGVQLVDYSAPIRASVAPVGAALEEVSRNGGLAWIAFMWLSAQ